MSRPGEGASQVGSQVKFKVGEHEVASSSSAKSKPTFRDNSMNRRRPIHGCRTNTQESEDADSKTGESEIESWEE